MAKTPAQKSLVELKLELPQGRFEIVLFFDRFGIEALDDHKLVHFGLETASGLSTSWSCVFESEMLADNKAGWLQYLDGIGLPEAEVLEHKWKPQTMICAPVANFVTWSRRNAQAEIRCFNFSFGDIAVRAKENPKVPLSVTTQGLALLRCSLDTQRQLLLALYGDLFQ